MRLFAFTLTILLFNFFSLQAQNTDIKEDLIGTWEIDLRPSPDSDPYLKDFIITKTSETTFKGTFYGSNVKNGLINLRFGDPYLAFKSQDRSNTYYHFAKIVDGKLEGLTYSEDRQLIQPWKGQKME